MWKHTKEPYQRFFQIGKGKGEGSEPRDSDETTLYCTYHHSYGYDTAGCKEIAKDLNNQRRNNCSQRGVTHRQGRQPRNDEQAPK